MHTHFLGNINYAHADIWYDYPATTPRELKNPKNLAIFGVV